MFVLNTICNILIRLVCYCQLYNLQNNLFTYLAQFIRYVNNNTKIFYKWSEKLSTNQRLDINYKQHKYIPWLYSPPIDIGKVKQLLCDDFLLAMAATDQWDQLFYNVKFANGW